MEHASLTNIPDDPQSNTISEDFQPSSLLKNTSTDLEIDNNPPEPNSDPEDHDKSKAELSHLKKKYAKISNQRRLELIDSVENKGQNIKQAAQTLKLNYSSAKSIFQVFKKEGRSIKKAYKQRYVKKNNNSANLEIPNPPCDDKELKKLLLSSEPQTSFGIQQKLENLEQQTTPIGFKDKLLGSSVGSMNQSQSLSDTTTQANPLTPIQSISGFSKSPLTSDTSQNQFQQVFMFPANFGNNQNAQMGQNNGMNMQQMQMQQMNQTRYEMRNDNFNTINFVPQQQTYMVYQGNMQPFMMMNSQPMFQQQQNNPQGMTFQKISQPQINEQNQKMMNFNEPTKIENGNQISNVYMVNNQNSNEGNRAVQMNTYHSMTPMNQVQYFMPTQQTTYFVGGNGNNNNNMYQQVQQVQQVHQMQPMMYVQSQQPNYYVQAFTSTNDVYMPQQSGFVVFGDMQNQMDMQEDMMKAKKENL